MSYLDAWAEQPKLQPNEFRCAQCGGVFDKGVSDEEALAESRSYFGELPLEQLAAVCDGCWLKIHPQRN